MNFKKKKATEKIIFRATIFLFIFSTTLSFRANASVRYHKKNIFLPTDSIISADSSNDSDANYREFIFQDILGTNSVVKGRTNGNIPYSEPGFTYNALSGFTCGFTINRLLGKYNVWDEKDAIIGWNFDFTDNWDGAISYSHQFYNKATPKLNSILDNVVTAETGYDFDIIYTSLTGESDFGSTKSNAKKASISSSDFSITWLISHKFEIHKILFRKKKKDELDIEPAISWDAGTQNFYDQYFKKQASDNGVKYVANKSSSAFGTLDYEFSIPVTYTVNRFAIAPEWDYYIPENIISTNVSSKPYGIGTLTLSYTFKTKK